jgi:hypothetical protein
LKRFSIFASRSLHTVGSEDIASTDGVPRRANAAVHYHSANYNPQPELIPGTMFNEITLVEILSVIIQIRYLDIELSTRVSLDIPDYKNFGFRVHHIPQSVTEDELGQIIVRRYSGDERHNLFNSNWVFHSPVRIAPQPHFSYLNRTTQSFYIKLSMILSTLHYIRFLITDICIDRHLYSLTQLYRTLSDQLILAEYYFQRFAYVQDKTFVAI